LRATNDWSTYFANIPGASKGIAMNDAWGTSVIRMEFLTDTVRRAGLLLSTTPVTTWTLEAYDAANNKIIEVTRSMPAQQQARFLGVQSPAGIPFKYIIVREPVENGNITLADDLRFEAIPEPATLALLGCGALALLRRRG
jgi:hypothetical protein